MKVTAHIPNGITVANLASGLTGITFALSGDLQIAAYCIWVGALFDFFDGFAARLLGVSSPIGKELDSLADMVTFGTLPAMMLYQMATGVGTPWVYLTFLVALFSALRLAKFNIDTQQEEVFVGLPTPACALFVSALPFIEAPFKSYLTPAILVMIGVIFSFLLVAPIRLFSLKFKDLGWKNNQIRYIFVALSLILLIAGKIQAIAMVIVLYILLSVLNLLTTK